ncbi:TPA: hypothetical protein QCY54_002476 [Bacillus cereus]|nr:hypothetical protein [Bacillus cereus]
MKRIITEDQMSAEMSLNTKPKAYNSEDGYPFEKIEDRLFEILIYYIFKEEIVSSPVYNTKHNRITLMPGVGEQGRDCTLQLDEAYTGVIQCKRYGDKLDKPQVAKEIIKFTIHYILDNSIITDLNNFTYYYAVSTDFTGPAITLLDNFNKNIESEDKLDSWISEVLSSYKRFEDLVLEDIKPQLISVLQNITIEKIIAADLNRLIEKYDYLVDKFFTINKVVPISEVEKLLKSRDFPFREFLGIVYNEISNIDGIRSKNIKQQLINKVEIILKQVRDMGEEEFKKVICSIKVPFLNTFQDPQDIKFMENKEVIKNIIINISLISFIYPDLKLVNNQGQAVIIDENKHLAYLHTTERIEYNVVILKLLKYFNGPNVNIGKVRDVIIGNVAAQNCLQGLGSAKIDFKYIISEISDVNIETAEGKEEFSNLKNKYKFNYHCEFAFNFQTKETIGELIEQLNKVLGGDRVECV